MRGSIILLILIATVVSSCGQNTPSTSDGVTNYVEQNREIQLDESKISITDFSRESYIHTESDYTDSTGQGIIIQNSYPRGGGSIYTAEGVRQYGHAVFWSRVINKSDQSLELNVGFPADSIIIYPSPNHHFKLLVPQDEMTLDKVTIFSFGLKNVADFVESNFYQPSQLIKTIPPNGEHMFYVILLSHLPASTSNQGVSRAGLFKKGDDLFYKLTVNSSISKLIPCGKIK